VSARILLFALDDLRARYRDRATPGADPRSDTAPFRAFRDELLALAARAAAGPCELSMWWEGTYNGYALAIAAEPAGAVATLDPSPACPVDAERLAAARPGAYPLARVTPGRSEVARGDGGESFEAPFGEATGHFGAPGMRRVVG
jgi:hypothetical protein